MMKTSKNTRIFNFLAALMIGILLVGCGSTPTVVLPPTQDIPAIRTESAATVVSKLTIEAALNPTATAAAPQVVTATPEPTTEATATTAAAEPTATVAVVVQPTNTTAPVTGGGSSGGGSTGGGSVAIPTATRRPGPDQASFIGQEPTDGTDFKAGNVFDAKFTFKNIGTSTWTTEYEMRHERGANLAEGQPKTIDFPKNVAPGETVTLIFDAVAPPDAGRHFSYWSLINENGDIFAQFYLVIDVQ